MQLFIWHWAAKKHKNLENENMGKQLSLYSKEIEYDRCLRTSLQLKHIWNQISFKTICAPIIHIQIPPDLLSRSHIMQYQYGYCKLEYRWGYSEGTLQLLHVG